MATRLTNKTVALPVKNGERECTSRGSHQMLARCFTPSPPRLRGEGEVRGSFGGAAQSA